MSASWATARSSTRGRPTRCRTAARHPAATPTSGRAATAAGWPCRPTSLAAEQRSPAGGSDESHRPSAVLSRARLSDLLRLGDRAQVGLHRLEAGRIGLLRLVIGDGRDDDDVLTLLPVHRRGDLVLAGELARVEEPEHLVEVAAR